MRNFWVGGFGFFGGGEWSSLWIWTGQGGNQGHQSGVSFGREMVGGGHVWEGLGTFGRGVGRQCKKKKRSERRLFYFLFHKGFTRETEEKVA